MKRLATILLMATTILSACGHAKPKQDAAAENTVSAANGRILVAYFSATGNTAAAAKKLAEAAKADLFEIKPAVAYTAADLDWRDKASRTTIEMNDKKSRVEIAGTVQNIGQYDTIFLGYPIWWYTAPHIINSFLEQYDLKGKRIILFATSGGSRFENSVQDLQPSAPGATIEEGRMMNDQPSVDVLREWVENLKK